MYFINVYTQFFNKSFNTISELKCTNHWHLSINKFKATSSILIFYIPLHLILDHQRSLQGWVVQVQAAEPLHQPECWWMASQLKNKKVMVDWS